MNSFQESKNELEAAIRYAENAISAAQATIESMQFRQDIAKKEYEERTGREQALEDLCNILNKCGFTLDGGTQDPKYIESSEAYAMSIVEKFHTNSL